MKITQDIEFKPISIILETKEEAEILFEVAGKIGGSTIYAGRRVTDKIYRALTNFGINSEPDKYFSGEIKAK